MLWERGGTSGSSGICCSTIILDFQCISMCVLNLSVMSYSAAPWTAALPAPLPRQEYWTGVPFPTQGNLPDPGIELVSPTTLVLAADSLPLAPLGKPSIKQYVNVTIRHISLGVGFT